MLGDFSLGNENLLKNSLLVFENIESKIENMKQKLFENSELSIHEIEAYSRSLNNLTRLLVKNWREIVLCSLKTIFKILEQNLLDDNQKITRNSIDCCERINSECKNGCKIKPHYSTNKISYVLIMIEELHKSFLRKQDASF